MAVRSTRLAFLSQAVNNVFAPWFVVPSGHRYLCKDWSYFGAGTVVSESLVVSRFVGGVHTRIEARGLAAGAFSTFSRFVVLEPGDQVFVFRTGPLGAVEFTVYGADLLL